MEIGDLVKKISPALLAFLLSAESRNQADMFQVALPNGQVIYANSSTQDITFLGNRYYASQFGAWERGAIEMEAAFQPTVKQMDLRVLALQSVLYPGTSTSLMATLNAGLFDGAIVTIYTIYWPIGQPPSVGIALGYLTTYLGQIGAMKQTGDSQITFDVYDMTYILNRMVPPNLIQSSCRHSLYNPNCTLVKSSFASANAIATPPGTTLQLNLTTTITVSPFYQLGTCVFTSGQNNGLEFFIKNQGVSGGVSFLTLGAPTPFLPAPGDTVEIYPGCDKTIATCSNKFNNLIHFGGMPFVPSPESAA